MEEKHSKTEKFLVGFMLVAIAILVFNVFSKEPVGFEVASAESEDKKSEDFEKSETSKDEEDEKSEVSEDEEDEKSEVSEEEDEKSEEFETSEFSGTSEKSEESRYDTQGSAVNGAVGAPVTTQSMSQESVNVRTTNGEMIQERSMEGNDGLSETSEVSEESELSEESVKSVKGYDEVVSAQGNKVQVKKREKLFGIFQTEIESEVTVDAQGNVVDEKKDILNWLRSVFSF